MKKAIMNFLRDEEGVTVIEYGLIAALVAVVIVAAFGAVGGALWNEGGTGIFNRIVTTLENAD